MRCKACHQELPPAKPGRGRPRVFCDAQCTALVHHAKKLLVALEAKAAMMPSKPWQLHLTHSNLQAWLTSLEDDTQ